MRRESESWRRGHPAEDGNFGRSHDDHGFRPRLTTPVQPIQQSAVRRLANERNDWAATSRNPRWMCDGMSRQARHPAIIRDLAASARSRERYRVFDRNTESNRSAWFRGRRPLSMARADGILFE